MLALAGLVSAEPILNNDTSPTSVFKSVRTPQCSGREVGLRPLYADLWLCLHSDQTSTPP